MKKISFLVLVTIGTMFMSCSKDRIEDQVQDDVIEDALDLSTNYTTVAEFFNAHKQTPQTFTFQPTDAVLSFTGEKGSTVTIDRSSLQFDDGSAVTGEVSIDYEEVLSPMDMIIEGRFPTSNGTLLQSGGQVNIEITSNGQNVSLPYGETYNINIPSDNPISPMIVFAGNNTANGFDWNAVQDSSSFIEVLPGGYNMYLNDINWINCDYWYNSGATLVNIEAVPCDTLFESFMAYAVFPDINSVMPMYANATSQVYQANNVPEGTSGFVIGIGLTADGELFVSQESFVAASGSAPIQLDCSILSEDDLLDILGGL